jgi:hypothetical protein
MNQLCHYKVLIGLLLSALSLQVMAVQCEVENTSKPQWLQKQPLPANEQGKYTYGYAHAKTLNQSRNLASAEIAKYFQTEVNNSISVQQILTNKKLNEQVRRQISVKSQVKLIGLETVDVWQSPKTCEYHIQVRVLTKAVKNRELFDTKLTLWNAYKQTKDSRLKHQLIGQIMDMHQRLDYQYAPASAQSKQYYDKRYKNLQQALQSLSKSRNNRYTLFFNATNDDLKTRKNFFTQKNQHTLIGGLRKYFPGSYNLPNVLCTNLKKCLQQSYDNLINQSIVIRLKTNISAGTIKKATLEILLEKYNNQQGSLLSQTNPLSASSLTRKTRKVNWNQTIERLLEAHQKTLEDFAN